MNTLNLSFNSNDTVSSPEFAFAARQGALRLAELRKVNAIVDYTMLLAERAQLTAFFGRLTDAITSKDTDEDAIEVDLTDVEDDEFCDRDTLPEQDRDTLPLPVNGFSIAA
ncbi:MAG: hypothetical protein ABIO72_03610 [Patescibacteria group bacterium]